MSNFMEILDRVTIRDILDDVGLPPKHDRISCPIHDGNNTTAFRFTDSTFICFSCGAKGGLLDLAQYLYECDRRIAMEHLSKLAGIPYEVSNSTGQKHYSLIRQKRRPPWYTSEYISALDQLEWLKLYQHALETALRILRRNVKQGKISPATFYVKEEIYLYELEELDPHITSQQYEVNKIKKEGYSK